jgi:hypothetical protein
MKSSKVVYSFLMVASLLLVSVIVLFLSSCGGKGSDPAPPELTAAEKAVQNLVASPWKVAAVAVDGADKTALFTGFTITFSPSSTINGKPSFNGNYSTTNGGVMWPNGSWTIGDINLAGSLQRGDGLTVQLTDVTATTFKMSLAWNKNTFGPGRVESIKGQFVFSMGK